MSILEIILYIVLGAGTLAFCIITILKAVRKKKGKEKPNEDE